MTSAHGPSTIKPQQYTLLFNKLVDAGIIEYGIFLGKSGKPLHVKLRKDLLLSDKVHLNHCTEYANLAMSIHSDDTLIGIENTGLTIARLIGDKCGASVLGLNELLARPGRPKRASRYILFDDNIISGATLQESLHRLENASITVDKIFILFNSSQPSEISQTLNAHLIKTLININDRT